MSPILSFVDSSPDSCTLRMFYHMYGAHIGKFSILRRTAVGGPEAVLFTRDKELGDYWERIDVPLHYATPFQIVIEGVVGNGDQGDIGIDDISFTPGCAIITDPFPSITPVPTTTTTPRCGFDKFECKSSLACIDLNKVCNFVSDCWDGSDEAECGECDFEKSECGWKDDMNNEFRWIRKRAPSDNLNGN